MNLEEIKERAKRLYKQGTRLDNKGRRPKRVEKVYNRVISMDPFNPAYHRRLISYLIRNDRIEEAKEAWNRSLDLLNNPEGNNKTSLYRIFHKDIAKELLAKGEREFAVRVLMCMPEKVVASDPDLVRFVEQHLVKKPKTIIRRR